MNYGEKLESNEQRQAVVEAIKTSNARDEFAERLSLARSRQNLRECSADEINLLMRFDPDRLAVLESAVNNTPNKETENRWLPATASNDLRLTLTDAVIQGKNGEELTTEIYESADGVPWIQYWRSDDDFIFCSPERFNCIRYQDRFTESYTDMRDASQKLTAQKYQTLAARAESHRRQATEFSPRVSAMRAAGQQELQNAVAARANRRNGGTTAYRNGFRVSGAPANPNEFTSEK